MGGRSDLESEYLKGFTPDEESVTETVLPLKVPLRAGEFKIINCRMGEQGAIFTDIRDVGVSVTLDWKPGNVYNPEI